MDKVKNRTFLGYESASYETAKVSLIPVPLEMTTSFQKGTVHAPFEIIQVSEQIEDYDIETRTRPYQIGIYTKPALNFTGLELNAALNQIERSVNEELQNQHFPILIGGEHSISFPAVKAAISRFKELGVIHFDAHADLREHYEGSPYSHACVMRRIHDLTNQTISVGIRSFSDQEAVFIEKNSVTMILADDFYTHTNGTVDNSTVLNKFSTMLEKIPERVYITFDVDALDPSLIPQTGTPEPGGLGWYQVLDLLRMIFEKKRVVGADVVEFMPGGSSKSSAFVVGKLIYKMIAYYQKFNI